MTFPTLHMGGTPREIMLQDYCRAHEAVYAAIRALDDVEFHQRDYPNPEHWEAAVKQRDDARKHLVKVLVYTESHALLAAEPLF